ncbi:MAG: hypothetical protein AAF404_16360 [Pseudomonadota bacterium]
MQTTKTKSFLTAVILGTALLNGCSSVVVKPVSESNKNTSGTYDGRWVATITNTAGTQYGPGNWQFTCADQTGKRVGIVSVADGKAQLSWDEDGKNSTYVGDNGKFRFEVSTGVVAAAGGTSDSSIGNGAMTLLIYGSLQSGKGNYTAGIAEFGNAGCTSKVKFTRM